MPLARALRAAGVVRCLFVLLLVSLAAASVAAQDPIRLAEVLPALEGTDLGDVDLGPAPPPGGARVVRRSEVLLALRRAGRSTRGLAVPRRTVIRRAARTIAPERLEELARPAIEARLAPCRLASLGPVAPVTIPPGELRVAVEGRAPARGGPVPLVVSLRVGETEVRRALQARVECPPPVVRAGAPVRLVARVGPVVASAPGVARQHGRVGEVIRVQNRQTRADLEGRVVDARTVEVLP
ncbi:MAG: flagella basal body P-ring formation protein FlgA [Sandaracinaceae bacterium]